MNSRLRNLFAVAAAVLALGLAGATHAASADPTGVVNVNSATQSQLSMLPGIGPAKARAILEFREAHPFKSVSELVKVKGIGKKLMQKLEPYVTVEGTTTIRAPAKKKGGKRAQK